jgi:hypothetical protein
MATFSGSVPEPSDRSDRGEPAPIHRGSGASRLRPHMR